MDDDLKHSRSLVMGGSSGIGLAVAMAAAKAGAAVRRAGIRANQASIGTISCLTPWGDRQAEKAWREAAEPRNR